MKKQIKTIYVLADTNANFFLSGSFEEFVSECTRLLESIPEEHRQAAKIDYCPDGDDGFLVSIYYRREETDEEVEARINAEKDMENVVRERELRMLAELKAKYERQNI